MSRHWPWLLAVVVLAMGLWGWRAQEAARNQAHRLEGEMVQARLAQRRIAQEAKVAWMAYTALGDTMQAVRASLAQAAADAAQRATEASRRAGQLQDRVRELAGDSAKVVAVVDSMVEAHAEQVASLETQIDAISRDREILLRRVSVGDDLVRAQAAQIDGLRLELDLAVRRGDAWRRAAQPSWATRLTKTAIPVAAGAVLVLALR